MYVSQSVVLVRLTGSIQVEHTHRKPHQATSTRPNFAVSTAVLVSSRIVFVISSANSSIHRFATTKELGNELGHQGCYLSAQNKDVARIGFGHQDKPSKSH